MDFYFIAGETIDERISLYRFLTGKAVMLPRWAYGFIQSQECYETQEEILEVVKGYRDRKIPLDCIVMDWKSWEGDGWGQKTFDKSRFPSPKEMTDKLHENNVKFMISIWPQMNKETENHKEFSEKNLLLPANDIYDAFNNEARELYWKQANEGLFSNGIDAWWCDSNEPFCPEWRGNIKPEQSFMYHKFVEVSSKFLSNEHSNAYGLVHAQTIFEGQTSITKEKRVTNLTRNSYTGGQRYGTIMWSGDTFANWTTLKNQIVAGLNFCATGLPYWTLDIGAFFVKKDVKWFRNGDYNKGFDDLAYRELFVRWFQYAVFLPVFRSHGTDIRREMWHFGEDEGKEGLAFYNALIMATKLRYSLLPYIYSMAGSVWLNDYTIMRMLAFDFAYDEKATDTKDEFMFGDSILVCPVTQAYYYEKNSTPIENSDKTKSVYLPKGEVWYDFYTGEKYDGGQNISTDIEMSKIPIYIKGGSIIPMANDLQNTAELENARISLHIYKGKDCSFDYYEDCGDGYTHEKGDYKITKINWDDKNSKVEILGDKDNFDVIIHD